MHKKNRGVQGLKKNKGYFFRKFKNWGEKKMSSEKKFENFENFEKFHFLH